MRARLSLALVALAWLLGCVEDPIQPPPVEPSPQPWPGIVSDPISSGPLASRDAGDALIAGAASVVYVSLPPGTLPGGERVSVRNRATGSAVVSGMVAGGVDPVGITAGVGDTLDIAVHVAGSVEPRRFIDVVALGRAPVVVRTDPPPRKRDVPLNASMVIVFSEPIDPASLTDASVHLLQGAALVPGRVEFRDPANLTAAFVPAAPLAAGADYTLRVTREIEDLSGDSLEPAVAVGFTTVSVDSGPAGVYERETPHRVPGNHSRYVLRADGRFELQRETVSDTVAYTGGFSLVNSMITFRFDAANLVGGEAYGTPLDDSHLGIAYNRILIEAGFEEGVYDRSPDTASTARLPPQYGQLAFARSDGIYLVNADGSGLVRLFDGPGGNPAWSPDGTRIAFGHGQIYVVNADGSGLVRLSDGPGDVLPAWSPDGSRIVFSRQTVAYDREIYVMNADGSNVIRRTQDVTFDLGAKWSPDGQWIAFTSLRNGSAEVLVMNANEVGSSPINITNEQGLDYSPAWSLDGTRIAWLSDWVAYDFTSDVFLMSPDGSQRTRLTNGFGFWGQLVRYHQPAWSPSGQRLAVVACPWAWFECSSSVLEVWNTDGSGAVRLGVVTSGFTTPQWSPDGLVITFESANSILWVRADGSERGLIVAHGYSPAWRP